MLSPLLLWIERACRAAATTSAFLSGPQGPPPRPVPSAIPRWSPPGSPRSATWAMPHAPSSFLPQPLLLLNTPFPRLCCACGCLSFLHGLNVISPERPSQVTLPSACLIPTGFCAAVPPLTALLTLRVTRMDLTSVPSSPAPHPPSPKHTLDCEPTTDPLVQSLAHLSLEP